MSLRSLSHQIGIPFRAEGRVSLCIVSPLDWRRSRGPDCSDSFEDRRQTYCKPPPPPSAKVFFRLRPLGLTGT